MPGHNRGRRTEDYAGPVRYAGHDLGSDVFVLPSAVWWRPKLEPFEIGNKVAVTHGAYSKDLVAAKANEIRGETLSRLRQVLAEHDSIDPPQEPPVGRGRPRKPRPMTPLEVTIRSAYASDPGQDDVA